MPFDGATYDRAADRMRLTTQLRRVLQYMLGRGWTPLHQIAAALAEPEGSVSARLRDLRKPKFGEYVVISRRSTDGGTWEYVVLPPVKEIMRMWRVTHRDGQREMW